MLKRQEIRIRLIFFIIICLLIALAVNFGCRKEGYYIDELWSYGLANSYETPFLQEVEDYMETWHHTDFYEQYLTVEPDRTFAWNSVYSNQARDVHPPLYYFLLHGISSLFPEKFSKWYGILINLLFFTGTILLLFELGGICDGRNKSCIRLLCILAVCSEGMGQSVFICTVGLVRDWNRNSYFLPASSAYFGWGQSASILCQCKRGICLFFRTPDKLCENIYKSFLGRQGNMLLCFFTDCTYMRYYFDGVRILEKCMD